MSDEITKHQGIRRIPGCREIDDVFDRLAIPGIHVLPYLIDDCLEIAIDPERDDLPTDIQSDL